MGTILLNRNALLKDFQSAKKTASGNVGKADRFRDEDVYWTGYANAIEDMIAAIASGMHDVEVKE